MQLITQNDCVEVVYKALRTPPLKGIFTDTMSLAIAMMQEVPTIEAEPIKDSLDNVFVLRVNMFATDGIINGLREMVVNQIRSGVVVLPAYTELLAITGPCTDVEVRIVTKEDKQA